MIKQISPQAFMLFMGVLLIGGILHITDFFIADERIPVELISYVPGATPSDTQPWEMF